jgi:hypothetical protein
MVSGIAIKIMIVPESSGFSARVPAPAAPILDCAQAVGQQQMLSVIFPYSSSLEFI